MEQIVLIFDKVSKIAMIDNAKGFELMSFVGKENHPVGEKLSFSEQRLRQQITRKDNSFLLILIVCKSENQAPQKVKPIEGNKIHRDESITFLLTKKLER